jgi:hypothetical protein
LLGLETLDGVLGHRPVVGASWEGFVIDQLIAAAQDAEASFLPDIAWRGSGFGPDSA